VVLPHRCAAAAESDAGSLRPCMPSLKPGEKRQVRHREIHEIGGQRRSSVLEAPQHLQIDVAALRSRPPVEARAELPLKLMLGLP